MGHAAIRASFETIFSNGAIPLQVHSVKRVMALGGAVHHVVERITLPTERGTQSAWVMSTNVYVKTAQGWRLLVHHASPGSEQAEAPERETPSILH